MSIVLDSRNEEEERGECAIRFQLKSRIAEGVSSRGSVAARNLFVSLSIATVSIASSHSLGILFSLSLSLSSFTSVSLNFVSNCSRGKRGNGHFFF